MSASDPRSSGLENFIIIRDFLNFHRKKIITVVAVKTANIMIITGTTVEAVATPEIYK